MSGKHVIIAGVNKCGTTSVFRYLANHPKVCASSVKETRFFNDPNLTINDESYRQYLKYFRHCSEDDRILVEASPDYFSSGVRTAASIIKMIPDVKIVVLVRDPVERLISYFRSAMVYDNYAHDLLKGLDFSAFVSLALEGDDEIDIGDSRRIECRRALKQGCYWQDTREFGSFFTSDQCRYFFFEDLVSDAESFMTELCDFLNIDPDFYLNHEFRVENKTRVYRSQQLQRLGFRVNMRMEPFFNKNPHIRSIAQRLYRWVNERKELERIKIDEKSRAKLNEFYQPDKEHFRGLLVDSFGITRFPNWLSLVQSGDA